MNRVETKKPAHRFFTFRSAGSTGKTEVSASLPSEAFYWLAALVLLAQLPHFLHLPVWVSLSGVSIVLLWVAAHRYPQFKALSWLSQSHALAIAALLGAAAVRLHYGYFLGRDPCVAMLFMLTACKFAETRQSKDASLLICLCGFLLLTQYFYSQTIVAGIVTIPAVIALGAALYSLTGVCGNATSRSTGQVLKHVAQLLLQGLPIALVLFVLFPRLPGPLWNLPADANATTGLSDSMHPGSISQLSQSHQVAFRVEFDQAIPAPADLYWRGPVLPLFDGRGWSKVPANRYGAPAESANTNTPGGNADANLPQGLASNKLFDYTVSLQPNHQHWLFALENVTSLPRAAPASGDSDTSEDSYERRILAWATADQQLITNKPVTQLTRYRVSSIASDSYAPSYSPAIGMTHINGRNKRTIAWARKQRAAAASDADYAANILHWFSSQPYYYTLQPPLLGDSPVDEFLFDSRRGFCEHYASAFTLLMRAAGIPSRVVTGYQGGEMNGDYMIVRQSDAHAWSEAWLDNRWQRFDPTAAVAPSRIEQGIASLPAGEPVPLLARRSNSWLRSWQLRADRINHNWQRLVVDFDSSRQESLWKIAGFSKPDSLQLAVGILLISGLWAWYFASKREPKIKPSSAGERIWFRTCQLFMQRGLPIGATETPANFATRLQNRWPQHRSLIAQHFQHLEVLRFAAGDADVQTDFLKRSRSSLKHLKKHCTSGQAVAGEASTGRYT